MLPTLCFIAAIALIVNVLMDLRDEAFEPIRGVGFALVALILLWAGLDAT